MSTHTPGPWHVTKGPAAREIRADDGPYIASVYDIAVTYGERNANARLIAAAPELLDAARLAVDAIGQTRDDFGLKVELEKAYLALRAAIAKAEGR